MKKNVGILIFVFFYIVFLGEMHLSKYLFKKYCGEEGRTGLFVYEKVELPKSFFVPEKQSYKDSILSDDRFILDDDSVINREIFNRHYSVDYYTKNILSKIGPIYSVDTTVIRISDQKVLSKVSSLNNKLGWFSRYLAKTFITMGQTCPTGRISGRVLFSAAHQNLIKNTFSKR